MNESQMKKRTLTFWISDFGFWIESQYGGWIYERIPDEKKDPHILDWGL